MTIPKIRQLILDCCNDITFVYNDLQSGVTSLVNDSVVVYQAWHGSKIKEYSNIDEVLNDKFYSGRSIAELIPIVDFDIE